MYSNPNRFGPSFTLFVIAAALSLGVPAAGFSQAPAGSAPKPATKVPAKTAEESLDQIIAALKSGDTSFGNLYSRLHKLQRLPVDAKRREEVAALLDPLLTLDEPSVRHTAQAAIEGWGTKKNEPTLLKLLEWQDRSDRHAAMKGLAALGGSKESAEAVAKFLLESSDRSYAQRALEEMGAFAEAAVWPHVGAADNQVHSAACRVLAKVGSSKSLVKLKALRKSSDISHRVSVDMAIRDMEKRLIRR